MFTFTLHFYSLTTVLQFYSLFYFTLPLLDIVFALDEGQHARCYSAQRLASDGVPLFVSLTSFDEDV